ncbi:MAG: hypothetical protein R2864_08960 [Syntrophotaleaceae bacterium]
MTKLYECDKCGVVTDDRQHLCSPREVIGIDSYCGSSGDSSQMCDGIRESAKYSCTSCGRSAERAAMVCHSVKLH